MKPSPRSKHRGTLIWAGLTVVVILLSMYGLLRPAGLVHRSTVLVSRVEGRWVCFDHSFGGSARPTVNGAWVVTASATERIDPFVLPLIRTARPTIEAVGPGSAKPEDEVQVMAAASAFLAADPFWTGSLLRGKTARSWPWVHTLLAMIIWIQWFGVRWIIIRLVEDAARTAPPSPEGLCRACGYATAGLPGLICPECGHQRC